MTVPHDVPPGPLLAQPVGGSGAQPARPGGVHGVSQLPSSVTDGLRHPGLLENPSLAVTVLEGVDEPMAQSNPLTSPQGGF